MSETTTLAVPVAGTYVLDVNHKRVGFVARHLMVSKIRGQFADANATVVVGGDPLQSSVTATIHAASNDTRQEQRDGHPKSADFIDVEKYPTLAYRTTGVHECD